MFHSWQDEVRAMAHYLHNVYLRLPDSRTEEKFVLRHHRHGGSSHFSRFEGFGLPTKRLSSSSVIQKRFAQFTSRHDPLCCGELVRKRATLRGILRYASRSRARSASPDTVSTALVGGLVDTWLFGQTKESIRLVLTY